MQFLIRGKRISAPATQAANPARLGASAKTQASPADQGDALAAARPAAIWAVAWALLVAALALAAGCLVNASLAPAAYAQTVGELRVGYLDAVSEYREALDAQKQNKKKFAQVKQEIAQVEEELAEKEAELSVAATAMYKHYPGRPKIIDMVLSAETIDEAFACWDEYQRIERYYLKAFAATHEKREELTRMQTELRDERNALAENVQRTKQSVRDSEAAFREASHYDGDVYHQHQGVSNNCGATAFTVGVNILLHDKRFTDNVGVWAGPGFYYDSTSSLAYKGGVWLAANGLSDAITIETIVGDIHDTDAMRAELEQGHVVVTSSGAGSVWQFADGSAVPGLFPDGHWIIFYAYKDGKFYANDSSVEAYRGAGCCYSEEELQQWLNGRYSHFSVRMFAN